MSEESFLAALDADPADDVTRLVYADWLEERGDERAAYLRQDVALGLSEGDVVARCAAVRERTPRAWVQRAGKRFDVWLTGYPLAVKIQTIKIIRCLMPLGLADAKRVSETVPSRVQAGVVRPVAELVAALFAELWPISGYTQAAENGAAAPGVLLLPAGAPPPVFPPMPFGALVRTSQRWALHLHAILPGHEEAALEAITEMCSGDQDRARRFVAASPMQPLCYYFVEAEAGRWHDRLSTVADTKVVHVPDDVAQSRPIPPRCSVRLTRCERHSREATLAALRATCLPLTPTGWTDADLLSLPRDLRYQVSPAEAERLRWIFPDGATLEIVN